MPANHQDAQFKKKCLTIGPGRPGRPGLPLGQSQPSTAGERSEGHWEYNTLHIKHKLNQSPIKLNILKTKNSSAGNLPCHHPVKKKTER